MDLADIMFNYLISGTLAIIIIQYIMNPTLLTAAKHNPLLDIPPNEVRKCR